MAKAKKPKDLEPKAKSAQVKGGRARQVTTPEQRKLINRLIDRTKDRADQTRG